MKNAGVSPRRLAWSDRNLTSVELFSELFIASSCPFQHFMLDGKESRRQGRTNYFDVVDRTNGGAMTRRS
jgi:hypothetical protein|tara:strand:- start:78 stop:287 length:210 start_codon:yes stop_codon:yes gene_type:complete